MRYVVVWSKERLISTLPTLLESVIGKLGNLNI